MNTNDLRKLILTDMKVELLSEFDRNFERKAFFLHSWPPRKREGKGSLLNVRGGGGLRGSIRASILSEAVAFRSGNPSAQIHNEGGDIKVTPKMKRFFWAKYYELSGKIKYKKSGEKSQSRSAVKLSDDAAFFRNMALMPVGSKIHIPKRQFIGHAPEVDKRVKTIYDRNLKNNLEQILRHGIK
jgi:phage gpG-like protein